MEESARIGLVSLGEALRIFSDKIEKETNRKLFDTFSLDKGINQLVMRLIDRSREVCKYDMIIKYMPMVLAHIVADSYQRVEKCDLMLAIMSGYSFDEDEE